MGRLGEKLDWAEPWNQVLDWNAPWAKWFVGGKLNVSHNCLDRHVDAGIGGRVAYSGKARTVSGARSPTRTCSR